MAYEPQHTKGPMSNVYDERVFRAVLLFGSSVLTSFFGKDLAFARNSAGNYTLTLPRSYARITHLSFTMQDASGAILFAVAVTDTVSTDGKLIFELRTEAGTATDATSGDKLFLSIGVSNDVLNDQYAALT